MINTVKGMFFLLPARPPNSVLIALIFVSLMGFFKVRKLLLGIHCESYVRIHFILGLFVRQLLVSLLL